jgi:hypothetical protein
MLRSTSGETLFTLFQVRPLVRPVKVPVISLLFQISTYRASPVGVSKSRYLCGAAMTERTTSPRQSSYASPSKVKTPEPDSIAEATELRLGRWLQPHTDGIADERGGVRVDVVLGRHRSRPAGRER